MIQIPFVVLGLLQPARRPDGHVRRTTAPQLRHDVLHGIYGRQVFVLPPRRALGDRNHGLPYPPLRCTLVTRQLDATMGSPAGGLAASWLDRETQECVAAAESSMEVAECDFGLETIQEAAWATWARRLQPRDWPRTKKVERARHASVDFAPFEECLVDASGADEIAACWDDAGAAKRRLGPRQLLRKAFGWASDLLKAE